MIEKKGFFINVEEEKNKTIGQKHFRSEGALATLAGELPLFGHTQDAFLVTGTKSKYPRRQFSATKRSGARGESRQ